ncbi:MAG: peroxiredoxin [Candidatus Bathyarchaeota archaeon]|nr:peroxiredoxin [Candidatus Bathyarchaeum sp.]
MDKTKAPDFCLQNQEDKKVCLTDYKGKWVILYFYPKDNSKTCTLEAVDFTDNLKQFEELDTIVIGVSPDSVKSHKNFASKHNLNIILLSDPEHQVLEQYKVWKLKKMYGRKYMGVERSTFIIDPEGYICEEYRKVRVKGHVEAIKQRIIELKQ